MAAADSTNDIVTDEPATRELEPDFFISVYGGGEMCTINESYQKHVDDSDAHMYRTWVNVSLLKRLGNLFSGSVESAASATDLILLMVLTVLLIAFFVLWQFVIFFIVLAVLALFSGGTALKLLKGTFIETRSSKVDLSKLDDFIKEQVGLGRFVDVRGEEPFVAPEFTKKALQSTSLFKWGIYISLIVATLFTVFEILSQFLLQSWLTNIGFLLVFGLSFLAGIVIMDVGAYMRRSNQKFVLDENTD